MKSIDEFMNEYDGLRDEGRQAEAIKMIEESMNDFPEDLDFLNLDLATLNLELGNTEKAIKILNDQLDNGVWYPERFLRDFWELKELKPYIEKWQIVKEEAISKAKSELFINLPRGYDKNKRYPLFIAFHGWGEDVKLFKKFWNSNKIEEKYILVMPQSSQIIGSSWFIWNNNELAHKELKEAYRDILTRYYIDTENIIVGGFSQGATLAMDVALNTEYMPVKGFITLNPDKPESFSDEVILNADKKGISGVILTGDKDGDINGQYEMMNKFNELDFKCRMVVKENFGHWFPEDLSERIDAALEYILE